MHKMRFFALIAMSLSQSVALVAQTATPTPRAVVADPARDARAPAASINAARFRVDTSRVYAVGHSMGGFMAVMAAARTRDLKGLVYLSGWDIGSEAATWRGAPSAAVLADYRESASRVQGTTGNALVAEMLAHEQEWSLSTVAPRIADRPIFMTAARHEEEDNPPAVNHEPLARALRSAGAKRLETQWFDTDHGYSDTRIALASAVVQWLNRVDAGRAVPPPERGQTR